jgi:hypothetical protein
MFDRLIFKGHLRSFFGNGAFKAFLDSQHVLLKEFKGYVSACSERVKDHGRQAAEDAGRPFIYLAGASTKRSGLSKDDRARQIAEADGVTEGLVCVFSTVEPCSSFEVRSTDGWLGVQRAHRKCLHLYWYLIHPEFGWCHVRVQTWFPFEVQVWVNGREWLGRRLDKARIGYEAWHNAIVACDDWSAAQKIADRFCRRRWARPLDRLARMVNPMLPTIRDAGFGGYYWVTDQAEVATDVIFADRATLVGVWPDLARHATEQFGPKDVLRFLGRKLHGSMTGEVTTSTRQRPEGWRVKHSYRRNSVKCYDKANVLRVETTINNPAEFKVFRAASDGTGDKRWRPMTKSVTCLWRCYDVATGSNQRYLEALGNAPLRGAAITKIDKICKPRTNRGKKHARIHVLDPDTATLFAAVLDGAHTINAFRNHDITAKLYPRPPRDATEAKRRCARTSRLIGKLRGHGLIAKLPNQRCYRITPWGHAVMSSAIHLRQTQLPDLLNSH